MNIFTGLGRVVKEIELKGNDTKFCSFTLAIKKVKGESDFISCKAFGKTAEMLAEYITKGQQIAVTGRIQTGSYEKEGKKVYTTDVIVTNFFFADSKNDKKKETTFESLESEAEQDLPF